MVDIDQKKIFQPLQPGALHAIALQDDGGIVVAGHLWSVRNDFRIRQRLVNDRDGIGQDDVGGLAHFAQYLGKGQR